MAVTLVQQATGVSLGSSTSFTGGTIPTLAALPTCGNLLVVAMGADKNCGYTTPYGFIPLLTLNSTSVSLHVAYKVAIGTEQTANPSWLTATAGGNRAWYGEYKDDAVANNALGMGFWRVVALATNITDEATTLSKATGTTAALSMDGFAFGFAAIDSGVSLAAPMSWSNSYANISDGTGTAGGDAGISVGGVLVSAGATTSSTFTYTAGTADQMSAAVVVFAKVSEPLYPNYQGFPKRPYS